MRSCPACGSRRLVTGRLLGDGAAVFRPDNLRFLALTLTGGVRLSKQSFACRDCGLIWNLANKDKLNRFLSKHCVGFEDNPAP